MCPSIPEWVTVQEPAYFFGNWSGFCRKGVFGSFVSDHLPLPSPQVVPQVVTMVREPMSRILSGYFDNDERLHDCRPLRDKHSCAKRGACQGDVHEGSARITNPAVIDVVAYAKCVASCAANMYSGHRCGDYAKPGAENQVVAGRIQKFAFVGLTEEWDLSICLFHAKFGGSVTPAELYNVRPGVHQKNTTVQNQMWQMAANQLRAWWQGSADTLVYETAKQRFWRDLSTHNIDRESCRRMIDADVQGDNPGMAICTLATGDNLQELSKLMQSIMIFYPRSSIFVAGDGRVEEYIHAYFSALNVTVVRLLDKYGKIDRDAMWELGTWTAFQMEKASILEHALRAGSPSVLYVDADTIFMGRLPQFGPEAFALSPHLISMQMEKDFGTFNGGYLFARSLSPLSDWRAFAERVETQVKGTKSSCCVDQLALDLLAKSEHSTMHPGVNVGWYQIVATHNRKHSNRVADLRCDAGFLKIGDTRIYSIHVHTGKYPLIKGKLLDITRRCDHPSRHIL